MSEINKIAYGEWAFPMHGPVGMKLASEIGFDGVHLTDYGGCVNHFPMNNPKIADQFLEAAAKYGLELNGYHLYSLSSQGYITEAMDTEKGKLACVILEKAIEVCKYMGIPNLMLSAEGPNGESTPSNTWKYKNYLDHLNYVCDLAADNGVTVSFEAIMPVKKILSLHAGTGYRSKSCYDLMNPLWLGEGDPIEEIPELGVENIALVHLKDSPADYQGKCTITTGINHVGDSIRLLKKLGYNGWFVSENYYIEHAGLDPYEAAARDLEAARKTLAEFV